MKRNEFISYVKAVYGDCDIESELSGVNAGKPMGLPYLKTAKYL